LGRDGAILVAPDGKYLIGGYSFAKSAGACVVSRHKYIPELTLILAVMARYRHGSPQISLVVVPFASHIKANQFSRAHISIEVVITSHRSKRTRENAVLAGHGPRPERHTVGAGIPALLLNDCFDRSLRYIRGNCAHSGG
jgi:hypothetical protein